LGALSIALAAVGVSCSNDDDTTPSNPDGTLQQDWTIAGSNNENLCSVNKAAQARLVVLDPALVIQATQFAPCRAFRINVTLHQNTYTGNLTFLDESGSEVSSSRSISQFSVTAGQTTSQTLDVPATAFLLH
jgi:hypothetical protein